MIKLGGVAAAAGILSHLRVTTADEVATDLKQLDERLAQQILDERQPRKASRVSLAAPASASISI